MAGENRTKLESTSDEWERIGNHLLLFEAPDLFISRARGDITRDDAETMFTSMQRRIDVIGPVFWIADVSKLGHLTRDSKTVKGPREGTHRASDVRGLAFVGASFHQRVIITLGMTANRLIRGERGTYEVGYFATEDEARAWIEMIRARSG